MAEQDETDLTTLMDLVSMNTLFRARTIIPGRILTYSDTPAPHARVQLAPMVSARESGKIVAIPPIGKVPVCMWGAGPFTIRAQLEKGDDGLCLVCDRALDKWLDEGGGTYQPGYTLTHQINDIVFLPFLRPDSKQPNVKPGPREMIIADATGDKVSITLNEGSSSITIKSAVAINIESPLVAVGSTGVAAPFARVGLDGISVPAGPLVGPIVLPIVPIGAPSVHTVKG